MHPEDDPDYLTKMDAVVRQAREESVGEPHIMLGLPVELLVLFMLDHRSCARLLQSAGMWLLAAAVAVFVIADGQPIWYRTIYACLFFVLGVMAIRVGHVSGKNATHVLDQLKTLHREAEGG